MFKNPDQLDEFLKERRQSAAQTRLAQARSFGQTACYYQGLQWFYTTYGPGTNQAAATGRKMTDWNPDSTALRATVNRVSRNIQKAAAATHPTDLAVDAFAPDSDAGISASHRAGIVERLANMAIRDSGVLDQARDAQFMRCITGLWGIMLYMADGVRVVDGQPIPDRRVRSAAFDPSRLILDPSCTARRLSDHEEVVYEDAWTINKIKRVFPQLFLADSKFKIDENALQTVGQLMSSEIQMNALSQGHLYANYRVHSLTKGAMVSQTHVKDETGRFRLMYVSIKDESGERCVNFDNPISPFGGDGLPLFLLHGHRRPMSSSSIGEGQMLKDDQDRLNLLMSLYFRMLQANGGFQWLIDKRLIPKGTSEEAYRQQFSNRVASVIVHEARPDKNILEPKLQTYPSPPQFLMDDAERFSGEMERQVSRGPLNFGMVKSHVSNSTNQTALDESDQVLGIRVQEDKTTYDQIAVTLTGTQIGLLKSENPGTLAKLRENGFEPDDFAVLLGTDEYCLSGVCVEVDEDQIRHRSVAAKQRALDTALQFQAIDAMSYRTAQASMSTPLTDSDRQMERELTRAVHQLLLGRPWRPVPLGEYNSMALNKLRRALWDRAARENPQVEQMVIQAIVAQTQAIGMEQALMQNPAEQQPAQPQPVGGDSTDTTTGGSIGDILMELQSSGGAPVGASQPAMA